MNAPHFRADRFRAARKRKGLTQLQLADIIGAAYLTLCDWERGKRTPGAILLLTAARVLDVDPYHLLNMDGDV